MSFCYKAVALDNFILPLAKRVVYATDLFSPELLVHVLWSVVQWSVVQPAIRYLRSVPAVWRFPLRQLVVDAKAAEAKMPGLGLQLEGAAFASRGATHDRTAYTLPCPVGGCSEQRLVTSPRYARSM